MWPRFGLPRQFVSFSKGIGPGNGELNGSIDKQSYGIYDATKAAVETLTAIASKELRGRSITVNAIAPGPTATVLFMNGKRQQVVDYIAKMAPLERLGTPEDITAVVAFLAGPDSAWINGQVLRANGGIT